MITQIIVVIALFFSGIGITKAFLFFPVVVVLQYILQMGLAFIFSAITVYIRDVEYIINIFMMLMFYLCPIVYEPSMIPDNLLRFFKLNPMFDIISFYRKIMYEGVIPDVYNVLRIFMVCLLVLIIGYFIFKHLEKRFAEEL